MATLKRNFPGASYTIYGEEEEDEGVAAWVSVASDRAPG